MKSYSNVTVIKVATCDKKSICINCNKTNRIRCFVLCIQVQNSEACRRLFC